MAQGYTRRTFSVLTGGGFTAATLNAVGGSCDTEFNAIAQAFHQTIGHTHDGTIGQGPKIVGTSIDSLPDPAIISNIKNTIGTITLTPANHAVTIDTEGFQGDNLIFTDVTAPNQAWSIAWKNSDISDPITWGRIKLNIGPVGAHGSYSTFDITDLLARGDNVVGTSCSFGWQNCKIGYDRILNTTPVLQLLVLDSQTAGIVMAASTTDPSITCSSTANVTLGVQNIGTTATSGFFGIATTSGPPTGVPINGGSGWLVFDTTNNKFWAYNGAAWKGVVLT